MATDPQIEIDLDIDQIDELASKLRPKGFKMLSLSMYGDPKDARYAAVFDKRKGADWELALGFTIPDMIALYNSNKTLHLHPKLVTATGGGGVKARVSVVFEKLEASKDRELTFNVAPEVYAKTILDRAKDGWIPMTATIYDDAKNDPLITTVWAKNQDNVAWTALVSADGKQMQEHFNAEMSGWARPAFMTASTQGRFLTIFRDDHLGPIGKGFTTVAEVSREQFEEKKPLWLNDGFHTVCLQGRGSGVNRRFAAIAVNNEKPLHRVVAKTGSPELPQVDKAMIDLMKKSNIRGAAVAVVKGTKLILARGYSWAEPGYPPVLPTTLFRLGSVSKFIAALALHQLEAEGRIKLTDTVSETLPLTPPDKKTVANDKYLNGAIGELTESSTKVSPRYEQASVEIADAFKTKLPVKHEQIAKFWITKPTETETSGKLDDFGFFLAGQIVKTKRNQDADLTMINATGRITDILQIKRIRSARSKLIDQAKDEARYHSRDLELHQTVMSGSPSQTRALVPREYGDENLETMEASGGLSAAVTDLARILAAMNSEPYTPLGRKAVDNMLKNAENNSGGYGFDKLDNTITPKLAYLKGGELQTTQAGLYYRKDDLSYVVVWNGIHTGVGWKKDGVIVDKWYPKFTDLLTAVNAVLPDVDLFPQFKMDSFAPTQDNFRWCKKCQGLFHGAIPGGCPKDGVHDSSASKNYTLMHSAAFKYGEDKWRVCKKCQGLFFDAPGAKHCPASTKAHQGFSITYSLVKDSAFKEDPKKHQTKWRRCKKCQGLFFNGKKATFCPAGSQHEDDKSGDYGLAFS
ncbi:MAG: serine hydrolase [Pyrinomonadaceae bacterium]